MSISARAKMRGFTARSPRYFAGPVGRLGPALPQTSVRVSHPRIIRTNPYKSVLIRLSVGFMSAACFPRQRGAADGRLRLFSMQGFTAWRCQAPPRTPGASRPSGESPSLSPDPLLPLPQGKRARLQTILYIRTACVQLSPHRCGDSFTRGRNARVHSVCFLTGKKQTSLAPCALGGNRLATSGCEKDQRLG